MRKIIFSLLALTLLFGLTAPASAADAEPAMVVRLKSIDGLAEDAMFLAKQAGRGEDLKQVGPLIKAFLGENGLDGLDMTKPLGAYFKLGVNVIDSEAVVLIPSKDEKKMMDLLRKIPNFNPEKGKDGVYTVEIDNAPFPVFFRFANGYAYFTARDKDVLAMKSLLKPAVVFSKTGPTGSLILNLDNLPAQAKEMANGYIARVLADLKEKGGANTPEPIKKLQVALLDEAANFFKTFVKGAGKFTLSMNVDKEKEEFSLSLDLSGKKGSDLAKMIADVEKSKSVTSGMLSKSFAGQGSMHVALPSDLKKPYQAAIVELKKIILKQAEGGNEFQKKHITKLVDALTPTVERGELDQAMSFIGPDKDGKYTMVAATSVVKGKGVEKVVKTAWGELPDQIREQLGQFIKLDAMTVNGTNVHVLNVGNQLDDNAKVIFGESPVHFALRDDALILAIGPDAKKAITSAIKSEPVTAEPFKLEISMKKLATLLDAERPGTSAIAKKVFADGKGDRIRAGLKGGDSLQLRLGMDAKLIKFFTQLDAANN